MASEPARKLYDDDGVAASPPRSLSRLQAVEVGGETSPPTGHLRSVAEPEERALDREQLSEREESGGQDGARENGDSEGADEHPGARPGGDVEDRAGIGYVESETGKRGTFLWVRSGGRRRLLIGGGIGGLLLAALIGLFGFLNIFKLDGLISNIDDKAFRRNNAAYDKMSSKMLRQYIIIRLAEYESPSNPDGKDNYFFRANRVDNNNPLFDWYRTMRASKFEKELFDKQGIKFVSVLEPGKIRKAGIVKIKNKEIPLEVKGQVIDAINKGDWKALNQELRTFVDIEVFDKRSDFRNALNSTLHDVTHDKNVFQRRHLRKAITNMLGYRSWRFFSDTRDKVDQKQLDTRNKVIQTMLPEKIRSGKLLSCLFGLSKCRGSVDAADPSNRAEGLNIVEGRILPEEATDPNDPAKTKKVPFNYDQFLSKLLTSLNVFTSVLNVTATMEMLKNIDKNISQLYKLVVLARGTQAMGLYQVMKTSRDQIKNGNANPAEINQFMQIVDNAAGGEGWTKVVAQEGDSSKLTSSPKAKEYCSQQNQAYIEKYPEKGNRQFAYLCAEKQIGSASTAQSIQDAYNGSLGPIIKPIVAAWDGVTGIPLLGDALKFVLGTFSTITDAVVRAVLDTLGLADNLENAMKWLFGKIAAFVGAGPIIKPNDPAAVYFNWMIQGGAYTAESASRHMGAAASTPVSQAATLNDVYRYQADRLARMSFYERVLSLENPQSIGFRFSQSAADALTNPRETVASIVPGLWNRLAGSLRGLFVRPAAADVTTAYKASSFAAIQTFDFPANCSGRELIDTAPKYGTNIQSVLAQFGITVTDEELTWDLVSNNNLFYDFLYQKLESSPITKNNADEVAITVYNCNLLDTAVRGSTGYVYGYKDDYGLEEGAGGNASSPNQNNPAAGSQIIGNIGESSDQIACAPGTKDLGVAVSKYTGSFTKTPAGQLKIRLCQIADLPGEGNNAQGAEISGGAVVNSRVSAAWLALAKASKSAGITLTSNSSFRLADSCEGSGDGTSCAKPGQSPHQLGVAIDFAQMSAKGTSTSSCSGRAKEPGNPAWDWLYRNAQKYGFKQYSYESWHWDALNMTNRCGYGQ